MILLCAHSNSSAQLLASANTFDRVDKGAVDLLYMSTLREDLHGNIRHFLGTTTQEANEGDCAESLQGLETLVHG
jgi:hypothetical protein